MKKIVLLFLSIILGVKVGFTQNFMENFAYTQGAELIDQTNPSSNTKWTEFASYPKSNGNPITVQSGGLTFPDYGFSTGNCIAIKSASNEGAGATIKFKSGAPYIIPGAAESGVIYASFLVNINQPMINSIGFFNLNTAAGRRAIFTVKRHSDNNLGFGLLNSNTTTNAVYTDPSKIYTTNVTYLIVMKYERKPVGVNDVLSLYVFDPSDEEIDLSAEPVTADLTSDVDDSKPTIDGVTFRQVKKNAGQASDITILFDGLNISNTWASAVVLPVKLSSFTAKPLSNSVQLNWTTVSEQNNAKFEVLRSDSRVNFKVIATIDGKGTTSQENKYSYQDFNPLQGINYYRLHQVDFDGKSSLSEIESAKVSFQKQTFNVSTTGDRFLGVNVYADKTEKARFVVSDIQGRLLINTDIELEKGQNSMNVPAKLVAGVYVATIIKKSGTERLKFFY